ncbi:YceI family protein [Actibacterium sp. 188UL27-1]|uniref:YceI family protein n=1 Tax=Actibacterium sp. 188UL27-1 TaxID=2786961 RepID=UPI00195D9A4A|nr:YceI family protein [Actibacterium sp. 188UL27-1]MBM7069262.1 YceI family protein [Actibacterium sp. 188UL27-1]
MITQATTSLAVLAALTVTAMAEPQRYELDPTHTTIAFLIDHIGYAGTLGVFTDIEGGFTYDMETQELSAVTVTVQTASVNSFKEARDGHVRNTDFLSVDAHPTMTFTATGGTPSSDTTGTVEGELTLLGETRPLTLEVTLNKAEPYPFGHKRFTLGLTARGSLNRSEFGMGYGVENGLVGDTVDLIIEAEAMQIE